MSKFLIFLSFLALLCSSIWAEDFNPRYEARIPFYDGEKELGEVDVMIEGERLVWIHAPSLISVLKNVLTEKKLDTLSELGEKIPFQKLPFSVLLDVENLKLIAQFRIEERSTEKLKLRNLYSGYREEDILTPAPFGGAINSRLEHNWGNKELGPKGLNGQFNSFMNFKSVVFENQTYYQEDKDQQWYRGDTRLVKDFQTNEIRTQAGDIYPMVQGFMIARPMGGVNVQRNFSLNPYRLPYPTGQQTFTLRSRSLVKYFVNGVLVKTEYLTAGNYQASDIPLNNGLNVIVIEATDDLGFKQVFTFRSNASINLLNEGESRFDLSYGTPFIDNPIKRDYRDEEGKVFSGFYQYGFSSSLATSVYLQNQQNFNLAGAEAITATTLGNFSVGHAQSSHSGPDGMANSLGYQLIRQGNKTFHSYSLGLRYENRTDEFKSTLFDSSTSVQNLYAANLAVPVANIMTMSIGGNYGDVRDNSLEDRFGIDTTINFRLFNHHNLSFFVSRNRDEYKKWNDVAYVFLTITFPGSNDFASAFYDQQQKSSRLSYTHDNLGKLYSPRAQITGEHNEISSMGEADILYSTPLGDVGGRILARQFEETDKNYYHGGLRIHSALVFAYKDGDWGLGISRPVNGSFAIFKPEESLANQKVGLKSTSPFTESESGLFNEITFTNLLAYQHREVQLDPTMLEEGRSLIREKFLLFPSYRSAHLIRLEERGSLTLRGRLYHHDGTPVILQVGKIGQVPFFTNRDGEFYVEGIEPGKLIIDLDESKEMTYIEINQNERGLKDMGPITLGEAP